MIPDDIENEKKLRAWAIEQCMQPGATAVAAGADVIATATRIVAFVKGDGSGRQPNGRKRAQ